MASIPRPRLGVTPAGGSVGRQQINAPVESFGSGAGVEALGRGIASIGSAIEEEQLIQLTQAADRAEKTAKLQADRRRLEYDRQTQELQNKLLATKNGGQQVRKSELYLESVKKIKENLLKDITDPFQREEELLKLERADLEKLNSLESSQRSDDKDFNRETRDLQRVVINDDFSTNHSTLTSANVNEWFKERHSTSLALGNGLVSDGLTEDQASVEVNKQRRIGFNGALNQKIAGIDVAEDPELAVKDLIGILDQVPETFMPKDDAKLYKDRATNALNARREKEDRVLVDRQNKWVDDYESLIHRMDTPAQRQVLLDKAFSEMGSFTTSDDITGAKAFQRIKNTIDAYKSPRQTSNSLLVDEVLYTEGPEEARKTLDKLLASKKVVVQDGVETEVRLISGDQARKARIKIEKYEDTARNRWLGSFTKRLRKLSEEGKLYTQRLESKAYKQTILKYHPLALVSDDTFEPIKEVDGEAVPLELGESAGLFETAIPWASDWDENQIEGQDLEDLISHLEKWADSKGVVDEVVLENYTKKLLSPIEKAAAMKSWRQRMELEDQDTVRDRTLILENASK